MIDERLTHLLLELVELNDALARLKVAADGAALSDETRKWVDRFMLTRRRVESALSAQQVLLVNSLGQPCNPDLHHVIEVVPSSQPPGTIVEVLADAYAWTVYGRMVVLRPGEVKIAGPQPPSVG